MDKYWIKLLVALLFVGTQLWAANPAGATAEKLVPQLKRERSPDFTLPDTKGQPVTLSAYKGKVVLLDFWATWCGGCKLEIPWYVEFYRKYRNQGLVVIGVSMDDKGMAVVKPFVATKSIDYPVVIGTAALAGQYHVAAMPTTLLIDREGRIALSHTGVVNRDGFKRDIKRLLE